MFALLAVAALLPTLIAAPAEERSSSPPFDNNFGNQFPALRDLALLNGKKFMGTAFTSFFPNTNPQYLPILQKQFGGVTPENEMKWSVIEPEEGVFNFTGADIIVAEARKTGQKIRGHNFMWTSQTPEYVTNQTDPVKLTAILEEHINAVMGRYCKDLYAFDVVNEPLNSDGTFADSVWFNVLGPSFIELGLNLSHKACPTAKLYVNDFSVEDVNTKSQTYAAMAKELRAKGVHWDGMGFESHFILNEVAGDIGASMKQFTDLGMDVALTELDIRGPVDGLLGELNATQLEQQAEQYAFYITACLENPQCVSMTVWEFGDSLSWVPGAFPNMGGADLYDFNFNPKPAFFSTQKALINGTLHRVF